MPNTTVYVIGDSAEAIEKVKSALVGCDCTVTAYNNGQWREGLENSQFRLQLVSGIPALIAGASPVQGYANNVLPFPSPVQSPVDARVATMNELESKAIENAIYQFKGNLTEAAKALGIGRATLYRKVKQYEIDPTAARRRKAAA